MKTFILVLATLCASAAYASAPTTKSVPVLTSAGAHELLDDVALNAAAGTRTIELDLSSTSPTASTDNGGPMALFSKLVIRVFFTHSAATTVTAIPSCAQDGTNFSTKTTKSCSSGTCDVYERTDSNAVTGDEDFDLEFDVRGCRSFKAVFGGAGADGSDLVDVQATAIVGK